MKLSFLVFSRCFGGFKSESSATHKCFLFPKASFQDSDFLPKMAGEKPLSCIGVQQFPLLLPSDEPSWPISAPGHCSTSSDTLLFWLIPSYNLNLKGGVEEFFGGEGIPCEITSSSFKGTSIPQVN